MPDGINSNAPIVGTVLLGKPLISVGTSVNTFVPLLMIADDAGLRSPAAAFVNIGSAEGEPTSIVGCAAWNAARLAYAAP
ncbi:hypothetical protein D3C87_1660220 [compost metagenome]